MTAINPHPAADASRVLTELDELRLRKLIERAAPAQGAALAATLDRAQTIDATRIAPDVVTMGTRLQLLDLNTEQTQVYTLSYPADADPAAARLSVLAPLGAALLGARRGERLSFLRPDGSRADVLVQQILYQPEAHGDYLS